MIHRSSIIPGFSKFIDENILAHYPATSMKRILMAGAISLYLKQGESLVDTLISNPLVTNLGIVKQDGMIDIDTVKETLKNEINKAGFMRVSVPMIGDIDFTPEDADALYKSILEANTMSTQSPITQTSFSNGGIY